MTREMKQVRSLVIVFILAPCAVGIVLADETTQDATEKQKEVDNPFAPVPKSVEANSPGNGDEKADKEAGQETEVKSEITTDQIKKWIAELDSDKYAQRENATLKLIEAGGQAIDSVSQATESESREAASRAVRVLKEIMRSGDSKAKAALEKLAASENERIARRAKKALEENQEDSIRLPVRARAGLRLPRLQVQRGARVVQMRNVNGEKVVDVSENGTKIHITDSPTNGIKIKVTEKMNGKDKVTEYAAKDKEDLKKKHPEGLKIYEKHMAANGPIVFGGVQPRIIVQNQIPVQAVPVPRFAIPRPGAPPNGIRAPAAAPQATAQSAKIEQLTKELKNAQERITKLEEELKQLKEESPDE